MKIRFTCEIKPSVTAVTAVTTIEQLHALSAIEEIGHDEWDNAVVTRNDERVEWVTAWSGFRYTFAPREGQWYCEYSGAQNGFLRQSLIPVMEGVKILEVDGSYGTYSSIAQYNAARFATEQAHWEKVVSLVGNDVCLVRRAIASLVRDRCLPIVEGDYGAVTIHRQDEPDGGLFVEVDSLHGKPLGKRSKLACDPMAPEIGPDERVPVTSDEGHLVGWWMGTGTDVRFYPAPGWGGAEEWGYSPLGM